MNILRVWLVPDGFTHHTSHVNSEKGDGEGAGRGMARRLSRSDEDLRNRVVYACRTVRALGRTLTLSFLLETGRGRVRARWLTPFGPVFSLLPLRSSREDETGVPCAVVGKQLRLRVGRCTAPT
jgi:hypothetical protein